jgi:transcriptional regulator with XRE-family HTH domain
MKKEIYITFGKNIRDRRKALRLSQGDLAARIGFSRVQLCNLETGKSGTTLETLIAICSVLKCTPNDIMPPIPDFEEPQYPIYFNIY